MAGKSSLFGCMVRPPQFISQRLPASHIPRRDSSTWSPAATAGAFLRRLPFRQMTAGVLEHGHPLCIERHKVGPRSRDIPLLKDGLDRTLRRARVTIDTRLRIDV